MRTLMVLAVLIGTGCATGPRPERLEDECYRFVREHGRKSHLSRGCVEALDLVPPDHLDDQCYRFIRKHGRENPRSRGCVEALDRVNEEQRARNAAIVRGILQVVGGVAEDTKPKPEIICKPIVPGAPEHGMKCREQVGY